MGQHAEHHSKQLWLQRWSCRGGPWRVSRAHCGRAPEHVPATLACEGVVLLHRRTECKAGGLTSAENRCMRAHTRTHMRTRMWNWRKYACERTSTNTNTHARMHACVSCFLPAWSGRCRPRCGASSPCCLASYPCFTCLPVGVRRPLPSLPKPPSSTLPSWSCLASACMPCP